MKKYIVVTGGAGFIGGNLIKNLNKVEISTVINLDTKLNSLEYINQWLIEHCNEIECIFHLGAITDTTETREELLNEYNLKASIFIWNFCATYQIPLIYASSAATYGNGDEGFDDEKDIFNLKPLNLYGKSKQKFDEFMIQTEAKPPYWYGLKFFNVYGFGEAHKDKMASVVFHAYRQINEFNEIKLFKSHNSIYKNGEQLRDFIYIDDIINVCLWLYNEKPLSGIYNVGTGIARTFNDLAKIIFKKLEIPEKITYIDTPIDIRNKYQYFTEAKINKLRNIGYTNNFYSLEKGIENYINKLKYENS